MSPLADLRARGLRVRLDGEKLMVGPDTHVTPEVKKYIAAHRAEIVAELGGPPAEKPTYAGLLKRADDLLPKEAWPLSEEDARRIDAAAAALDTEAVEREVARLRSRPEPSRVQIPHRPEEADTQLDEVFATLESQGAEGWTTNQYLAAGIPRTGARVLELRQLGFLIDSPTYDRNKVRYVLRGAMPGTHAAGWEAAGRPHSVSRLWALHKHEYEKREAA